MIDLDWTMFIAAMATDTMLRDGLISRLLAYASSTLENQPFEVVYNPLTGHQVTGAARYAHLRVQPTCADQYIYSPAQGAMFALLADQ